MRQAKVAEEREGAGDLSPLSSRFLPGPRELFQTKGTFQVFPGPGAGWVFASLLSLLPHFVVSCCYFRFLYSTVYLFSSCLCHLKTGSTFVLVAYSV